MRAIIRTHMLPFVTARTNASEPKLVECCITKILS